MLLDRKNTINDVTGDTDYLPSYVWGISWGPTYRNSYGICISASMRILVLALTSHVGKDGRAPDYYVLHIPATPNPIEQEVRPRGRDNWTEDRLQVSLLREESFWDGVGSGGV
jgi:hypothetical protein